MNIVLIGYRGCGKSSVGAILARGLGLNYVDCDAVFVERQGLSINDFVTVNGWTPFRDAEAHILRELLGNDGQVIATGGGVVLNEASRALLREQPMVVWLTASIHNIVARISGDFASGGMRPPLGAYGSLEQEVRLSLAQREALYMECACLRVDTDDRAPEQVAAEILWAWNLNAAQNRL